MISLTLDFVSQRVIWYVRGYEEQVLFSADLISGDLDNTADILGSVKRLGNIDNIDR